MSTPEYEVLNPGCQTPAEIRDGEDGMEPDITPGDTDDEEYMPDRNPEARVVITADSLSDALAKIRANYPDTSPDTDSNESGDTFSQL